MTKILQRAFEMARALPDERQDELGKMVLAAVEQENSPLHLTDDQIAEVRRRLAEPGPLASADEAEAFFKKITG